MHPILGIELDDKSHEHPDRKERDRFVDEVFAAAGLPILHIKVKRTYVETELANLLEPYLGKVKAEIRPVSTPPTPPTPSKPPTLSELSKLATSPKLPANDAPLCPKCNSPMVLRTAKSGANAGSQFWGCSGYPACRTMLKVDG